MRKNDSIKHADRKLRIIGGRWRGRKVTFEANTELRPTKDSVRETVFNWIGPQLPRSKCLDLFCGSGVLGLEALSRGARFCDFVDYCDETIKNLAFNIERLGANDLCAVHRRTVNDFLSLPRGNYDIVFVDAPFKSRLLVETCKTLSLNHTVNSGGLIYVEISKSSPPIETPLGWKIHRQKQSGSVKYCLYHQSKH